MNFWDEMFGNSHCEKQAEEILESMKREPEYVFVPKKEWEDMKHKLELYQQILTNYHLTRKPIEGSGSTGDSSRYKYESTI